MRAMQAILTAATLSLAASTASAQGFAPRAYYYPSAGYYQTTAGLVAIPAPGYYYNVPAAFAQPTFTSASYGYWNAGATHSAWTRGGGGPTGGTPYYANAVHSLHGRGYDSSRHR